MLWVPSTPEPRRPRLPAPRVLGTPAPCSRDSKAPTCRAPCAPAPTPGSRCSKTRSPPRPTSSHLLLDVPSAVGVFGVLIEVTHDGGPGGCEGEWNSSSERGAGAVRCRCVVRGCPPGSHAVSREGGSAPPLRTGRSGAQRAAAAGPPPLPVPLPVPPPPRTEQRGRDPPAPAPPARSRPRAARRQSRPGPPPRGGRGTWGWVLFFFNACGFGGFLCALFFFFSPIFFSLSLSTKNFLNFGELSGFNFLKGTGGHRAGGDFFGLPPGLQPNSPAAAMPKPPAESRTTALGAQDVGSMPQGSSPISPRTASLHPSERYPHIFLSSIPVSLKTASLHPPEQHPLRQQPLIPWESSPSPPAGAALYPPSALLRVHTGPWTDPIPMKQAGGSQLVPYSVLSARSAPRLGERVGKHQLYITLVVPLPPQAGKETCTPSPSLLLFQAEVPALSFSS